jgi:hypothetical protein
VASREESLQRIASDLGKGKDKDMRKILERIIEACQGNFDHLSGEAGQNVRIFNAFMIEFEGQVNEMLIKQAELESRIIALEP